MKPLALLLSLTMPAALAAQDTAQVSAKQDKKGWYRTSRENQESGVIQRRSFPADYTLDGKAKYLYCMIPAGADWVLDSSEEHVEEQYLRLVGIALHFDQISMHDKDEGTAKDDGRLSDDPSQRFTEPSTGVIGFCGTLHSPTPRADLLRIDAAWRGFCQNMVEAPQIGRYTCTQYSGGKIFQPMLVIVQTLKVLAKSPHAKTAKTALGLMEEIKNRAAFFAKTVSEVLLDPKTPPEARERAAEVLASVHTHDLSAITLATIWGNESNPESLRRAALRGYSLIMSFGDSRTAGSDPGTKGQMRDRLHNYLPSLAAVIQAETKDGKDGKGGKDTLTPLGEAAKCVAQQYSVRWLCYVNRNGPKWYEELKKDEAAGVDACASDGKLKR